MKNSQKIEMVGKAIFGENWKAPLALKLGVNERTMRRWADGEFEVSAGVMAELPRLIRENQAQLQLAMRTVNHGALIEGDSVNIAHLSDALHDEFEQYRADDCFSEMVDEWIQFEIERHDPENIDLVRDCVQDFLSGLY